MPRGSCNHRVTAKVLCTSLYKTICVLEGANRHSALKFSCCQTWFRTLLDCHSIHFRGQTVVNISFWTFLILLLKWQALHSFSRQCNRTGTAPLCCQRLLCKQCQKLFKCQTCCQNWQFFPSVQHSTVPNLAYHIFLNGVIFVYYFCPLSIVGKVKGGLGLHVCNSCHPQHTKCAFVALPWAVQWRKLAWLFIIITCLYCWFYYMF